MGVGGGSMSIENPHNKFHNRIGGLIYGGIQGSGVQIFPDPESPDDPTKANEFTGTMASNESIFDPIFWLHLIVTLSDFLFPGNSCGQMMKKIFFLSLFPRRS